ncbi:hypothetical protein A2955_04225 [Candidatus Woesebacteria bacterium RIFCSPLOWO2_01_FULL_37_19]|uniref:Alpha/beta hydrolase n=1 Tax=Candidatus Woesebacteria bacterium RIFCSPLOWO2_01_FULL_37_19 TaxID=1802514 RepID=A0A1F8B0K3_9BACT|nr:MAG: hypothetical protein A2955_04225 [Candidatus Woesebacteria bacterium RIFCSPLOWO2_01_FULL_37_19]
MKTVILPGYSKHNREWAEDVARKLKLGHKIVVHEWKHWSSKGGFSLKSEVAKILEEVGNEKVNIIAKSVGVFVALNLIPKIPTKVNKVIFCGIASVVAEDRSALLETSLLEIPVEYFLCIQNEHDKYVPFAQANEFYHAVEPKLKVISKPRSDHNYPYFEDFQKFLKP